MPSTAPTAYIKFTAGSKYERTIVFAWSIPVAPSAVCAWLPSHPSSPALKNIPLFFIYSMFLLRNTPKKRLRLFNHRHFPRLDRLFSLLPGRRLRYHHFPRTSLHRSGLHPLRSLRHARTPVRLPPNPFPPLRYRPGIIL